VIHASTHLTEADQSMITALVLTGTATSMLLVRLWVHRHEPPPAPDPFEALRLQIRLHALADEINQLHHDESIFARAARLEARADAYDALLGKACCLAGVSEAAETPRKASYATPTPVRLAGRDLRARRELLLAERGWSW
jgi:hypothetical protein